MTNLNEDYKVTCYSGAARMQSELTAAFNLVANKSNWKLPVHTWLSSYKLDVVEISDAIVHFTGSVPKVTFGPVTFGPAGVLFEAKGYYATIGA